MRKLLAVTILACLVSAPVLGAEKKAEDGLPVTRIVLFSSGVGYFEHAGKVKGDTTAELPFKAAQINDVLKSLVLKDMGGGTISTVSYPSRDPLARVLGSFQVDIASNPPLAELLNRLRGAEVTISGAKEVSGKVLGVEKRRRELPDGQGVIEEPILNVLVAGGVIRSVDLRTVIQVKLADAKLAGELSDALAALAAGRDKDRKPVRLSLRGKGERDILVGYVIETPVWKTSYRLVLRGGDKKPVLQGWAVVENTTDADWKDVSLSLVSGRPISFIQDLYTPLYAPRPVVRPELYAGLMPQLYEEGFAFGPPGKEERKSLAAKRGRALDRAARAPRAAAGGKGWADAEADRLITESLGAVAAGKSVGELYRYDLPEKVALKRRRSAMLPITSSEIEGEKLSIYNARVQARHPLNGLKLKNTAKDLLLGGPITVFDGGMYAGDARIDSVPPGDDRLISYAVDLEVTVDPSKTASKKVLMAVTLSDGVLLAKLKRTKTQTYVAKNKSGGEKMLLLEHPITRGWKLTRPAKPDEKTPRLYRFRMKVGGGKTAELVVEEEHTYIEGTRLKSMSVSQLELWVRKGEVSPKIKEALKKAIELKRAVAALSKAISDREGRVRSIGREQARMRENMKVVERTTPYYNTLLEKLGKQENELEGLTKEIEQFKTRRDAKQKELDDYLLKLALK